MKIAFLTTDTAHHAWFLQELLSHYGDVLTINETTSVTASFETSHDFEKNRDAFEGEYFFKGETKTIKDLTPCVDCENINDPHVIEELKSFDPDVIIVFGTRKIKTPLIRGFERKIINLHGGDPEYYRGLDTHLWAIYNDDFGSLETTLHILDEELDTGDIIQKQQLDLNSIENLSQLRAINTKACLDLCLGALKTYETLGYFITSQQNQKGTYYSFMPTELKETCVQKYLRFKSQAKS